MFILQSRVLTVNMETCTSSNYTTMMSCRTKIMASTLVKRGPRCNPPPFRVVVDTDTFTKVQPSF